jgi:hypothetical protein
VKVEIHLTATLRRFLPPGATGDHILLDLPPGTTVGQVVHSLSIPADLERLTVVNGLSLFPPLAGGR